jgi:2-amino-4-hydroxy-6-hydroxymethyldihydropteridine diphosphokinase
VKNSNSIFLSLGSNIGDKENNLTDAVRFISNFAKILKISSIYKTEPLLYKEQDDFFNIVIEIDYQKTARSLLLKIKDVETQMGRKDNFRYGPRLIDIDIIFFKGEEIDEEDLIIPHYDWQNRLFVVEPLYEVLNEPLDKSSFKIFDQKITNIGKMKT